jgi:hypothetical protein
MIEVEVEDLNWTRVPADSHGGRPRGGELGCA